MLFPTELTRSPRIAACDMCEGTSFDLLSRVDRRGDPLNTVICRDCGLISHERIPTDVELHDYYESQYRSDYHGEFEPSAYRVLRAWDGGAWLMKRLLPFVPREGHVFEVGAGIGCTVKLFERAGYRASGIEPGIGFSRFAQRAFGACVTRASLFDMPPVRAYDFILLVHVIEHFNSPRRALEYIHSMLRPGGRIYIECPNVSAPHAAPGRLFHTAHIYNFTPDTLGALAESCGFLFHARLSQPHSREIRLVLERGTPRSVRIPDHSYEHTLSRLRHYSPLTYHLRPSYVLHRILRDVRMGSNRIMARQRLHRLLQQCVATPGQSHRRAA